MTILANGTDWCIDTPPERATPRTIHRVTCTGPSVGKVVPLHNMKDLDEAQIRAYAAKGGHVRLCWACLPTRLLWCDYETADEDGRVAVDSGMLPPDFASTLNVGDTITAQDLMDEICPAEVVSVDAGGVVLKLDLDQRRPVGHAQPATTGRDHV